MCRLLFAALFFFGSAFYGSVAFAQKTAAIEATLAKAKEEQVAKVQALREQLLKSLPPILDKLIAAGDLDGTKKFVAERDAFEKDGVVPTHPAAATPIQSFRRAVALENTRLYEAYDAAIRDLTKLSEFPMAESLQKEQKTFLESATKANGPFFAHGIHWPPANANLDRRSLFTFTIPRGKKAQISFAFPAKNENMVQLTDANLIAIGGYGGSHGHPRKPVVIEAKDADIVIYATSWYKNGPPEGNLPWVGSAVTTPSMFRGATRVAWKNQAGGDGNRFDAAIEVIVR